MHIQHPHDYVAPPAHDWAAADARLAAIDADRNADEARERSRELARERDGSVAEAERMERFICERGLWEEYRAWPDS